MKVLELMKTHVVRTTPDATLGEAVDLMDLYQTNGLPVVDAQERLCGMLTENDVLRTLSSRSEPIKPSTFTLLPSEAEAILTAKDADKILVGSCMTQPAISISEHTDLRHAAQLMLQNHLKRLPVTNEAGQVMGVLNRIDLFQSIFAGDF